MNLRSLFKRLRGGHDVTPAVNNSLSLGSAELYELLAGSPAAAGVAVNEASAMRVTAVYACVRLIAGAIASLPLAVYRRTDDGRERVRNDLWWLLNEQPCPTVSAAVFWEYLLAQMLLSGDALAEIERGRGGAIRGLIPLDSRAVGIRNVSGRLRYEFCRDGQWLGRDQDDILHIPGFGFDGTRGMSVIRHAAREAIGLALAAEAFSSRFFASGAHPDVALKVPGKMTQEQIDNLRRIWASKYGGAHNASLPIVLTEGTDLKEVTLSAQDSQLIEARRFQVADIARAFGVPPHMVGETDKSTSWGSGIEQQGIGFVQYTLAPHLNRIEQEINRKCFRTERLFVEFNVEGLLRGDSKARAEYYCVFRTNVTDRFGIVTGDFGNVTGHFGNVTERTGRRDWRCA
ncbi:phage portal protein [Burkholderia multivorans]|uniref:phage portal protein n=1 Tax=Burkholderia multivorans TaxID=87883 RepID=UPI001C22E3CD|nr:phage portal protein [Burkholderia multivorans]MBU9468525.1 phage portal protein [Burkholderia multivorans]MCA8129730.1 phage portal protein [Burkholderia multivorans]